MRKSASSKKHTKPVSNSKLSEEEFVFRAIERLHKPKHNGIHTVYSGFNAAFREYFGKKSDPVSTTKQLAATGKLVIMLSRGGVVIYKKGEEPKLVPKHKDDILTKILG